MERVEDIDEALEANRIYGPVSVTFEAFNEFEDTGALTLSRLGAGMFAPKLSNTQRIAHLADDMCREVEKVGFGRAHPLNGFLPLHRWIANHGVKYTQLDINKAKTFAVD